MSSDPVEPELEECYVCHERKIRDEDFDVGHIGHRACKQCQEASTQPVRCQVCEADIILPRQKNLDLCNACFDYRGTKRTERLKTSPKCKQGGECEGEDIRKCVFCRLLKMMKLNLLCDSHQAWQNTELLEAINKSGFKRSITECKQCGTSVENNGPCKNCEEIKASSSGEVEESGEIVVPVSPSMVDLDSIPIADLNDYENQLFCPFCPTLFASKFEAYAHYSLHLQYNPIICLLCSVKFLDTESFAIHHKTKHPSAPHLMYEVREDFNLERWVDDFLVSQKKKSCKANILRCSCSSSCPVCERLFDLASKPPITGLCHVHSERDFSSHIHLHLAYHTFECSLCKGNPGKQDGFKAINLDITALDHVRKVHKKIFSSGNIGIDDLSKIFVKSSTIPKVHELIAESIEIRSINEENLREKDLRAQAESTKSQNPTLNRLLGITPGFNARRNQIIPDKQYLQSILAAANQNDRKRSSRPASPLATQPHNNVKMRVVEQGKRFVLKVSPPKKPNRPPNPFSRVIPQPTKSNHVRIEGGRVVNLPSAETRAKASQLYNNQNRASHQNQHTNGFRSSVARSGRSHSRPEVVGSRWLIQNNLQDGGRLQPVNGHVSEGSGHALSQPSLKCLFCEEEFSSNKGLEAHIISIHPNSISNFDPESGCRYGVDFCE